MYHPSRETKFSGKFKLQSIIATGLGLCAALLIFTGCSKDFSSEIKHIEPEVYLEVPTVECPVDKDGDGISDMMDIVEGARDEAARRPHYRDGYYAGGYPPEDEGVCTDVIWRAFRDAGYDLKGMLDDDIRRNIALYPRVAGNQDPNIDFRRVQNLIVFFARHGQELTLEVIPGDVENLSLWQPGDIVTYAEPYEHIAIISDRRRPDGVPYILHNGGPVATEQDRLLNWPSHISGHYRFPKF